MSLSPGKDIIVSVAREHGLSVGDLTGRSLRPKLCASRKEAMTRIRTELGYSFPRIGRLFNRHHASVIWAIRGGRLNQPRDRKPKRRAA